MSIVVNKEKNQFYLHTKAATYIIELLDGKFPMHVYFGNKLYDMPSMINWDNGYTANLPVCDMTCYPFVSSGIMPSEFPCYGTGDMREPAFHAIYSDGSRLTSLEYKGYVVSEGKSKLEGLPSSYGNNNEVSTLELYLSDEHTGLSVCLKYSVFENNDVITRSVHIKNNGREIINLQKIASMSIDFYDSDYMLLHLHGDWAREFQVEKVPLTYGVIHYDSKCGKTSHFQNPALVLLRPETTENYGEAYGINLVYSGNFDISVEKNSLDYVRVMAGINSFDFSWELKENESFQSPEAVMVYSDKGLGDMSRKFHKFYRENLCRGKYKYERRPILINNWEATYCNFDEEKLLSIAEKAKECGIEMLVLDDGWFGERNSDDGYLGDWVCNYKKLPNGLKGLSDKLEKIGMKFGIWMEPEMVSPNSNLYRAHPDWCIHVDGRKRNLARNQLVLDLSRQEVCDYIISAVSNVLNSASISYVKWDMNRCISDWGSNSDINQQEQSYRYVLGLYKILEKLTTDFPDVLFENCSSGGGRFDPAMLYYMPQTWCSDDSDAVERTFIQYGASIIYPPSTISCHVSACPNHQVGRITPLKIRGDVALFGQFGYELDLTKFDSDEINEVIKQTDFYKKYWNVICFGDMYRLYSPYENPYVAWEYISEDKNTVLLYTVILKGTPGVSKKRFRMQGLECDSYYQNTATGEKFLGSFLMNIGVTCSRNKDYISEIIVFNKI